MKKHNFFISICLTICLLTCACGGIHADTDQDPSASVSGNAVSKHTDIKDTVPSKMKIRTPYTSLDADDEDEEEYATFSIKERKAQEYVAEISLSVDIDDIELPSFHWELYLELEDDIKDISGAAILSHEGTHYIIQGTSRYSDDDGYNIECNTYKISFEIIVSCQDQIHEPKLCFFSKENQSVENKNYDCQLVNLNKKDDTVTGTIRLTNRSGENIPGWELSVYTNFHIDSLEGNYNYDNILEEDSEADDDFDYHICAREGNLDLRAGEAKEIPFVATCHADKPKLNKKYTYLYEQTNSDILSTWAVLEYLYGGSYGKMDTHLVADSVFGMDVLFVFDEKKENSYTATAELTNVTGYGSPDSEESEDRAESIADWEIYLECEDEITDITGADIVFHEGNVYHIRAKDPAKWVTPFSFTTFQVTVSCPGGIHPLGTTYLRRAKFQTRSDSKKSGTTDATEERTFSFEPDVMTNAVGTRWISYYDFYDPWFDSDYFDADSYYEESHEFVKRQKWGVRMKRKLQ